jgi:hypothetical protein
MTDVWVVLIEDRHADVEALPFSTEGAAVAEARDSVPEFAEEEQLTPDMRKHGWVLLLSYGTEGDCVRVVKRTMDGQGQR